MHELTVNGLVVCCYIAPDNSSEAPWRQDGDGRNLVRAAHRGETRRCFERELQHTGVTRYYFDWRLAAQRARAEKWNAEPYDAPHPIQRAVQQLFDYYRAYARDEWHYVGLIVKLAGHEQYSDDLWGVETYNKHHLEMMQEMAQALADRYLDDLSNNRYIPRGTDA